MTDAPDIGHNQPPVETPFEAIQSTIDDLYLEATQWLDGEPVTTQGQADDLNKLLGMIRDAEKKADTLRKEEVKPFDAGKKAVQERYAPLIGNTKAGKGKTVLAAEAVKEALTPWLVKLDEEKRAKEAAAREEAERIRRDADEALRASQKADLEARAEAERLQAEAKQAEAAAAKASKAKAHAKGGSGRATSLRTYHRAEVTDATAFARWCWNNRREEMAAFLDRLASDLVKQSPAQARAVPGLDVITEQKAV